MKKTSSSMKCPKTKDEWKQYEKRLSEIEELRKQGICVDYS